MSSYDFGWDLVGGVAKRNRWNLEKLEGLFSLGIIVIKEESVALPRLIFAWLHWSMRPRSYLTLSQQCLKKEIEKLFGLWALSTYNPHTNAWIPDSFIILVNILLSMFETRIGIVYNISIIVSGSSTSSSERIILKCKCASFLISSKSVKVSPPNLCIYLMLFHCFLALACLWRKVMFLSLSFNQGLLDFNLYVSSSFL